MPAKNSVRRTLYWGIAACALVGLVLGLATWARLLEPLDNRIYDFLLRRRASQVPADAAASVVLVLIDEESLASVNRRWPWPRSLYAQMLDQFAAGGARAVGLDILFIEPSEDPAEDGALVAAAQRHRRVVFSAKLEDVSRTLHEEQASMTGERLVLPLPILRKCARYGVVNIELGTGTVTRTFRPAYSYADKDYPSFAAAVYQAAVDRPPVYTGTGAHLTTYAGPPGTFVSVPAYQVLQGQADPALFRNRIVLVGATFSDAHDMHATPFTGASTLCPGVEVQANIVATMLQGTTCTTMPRLPQVLIVLVLIAACGYLVLFRSGLVLALFVVCAAGAVTGAATWLMVASNTGLLWDISYPLLAIPVTLIVAGMPLRKPLVLETRIGPYRLLQEVGRGGMAVVYKATHPRTDEIVALKQMLPQYTGDEAMLDRFLSEIELVRSIGHPNIVRIIDAGDVSGQPYYAMEYIDGVSLEKLLEKERRLPAADVRRICGGVARALAKAHDIGVIHRDIKPANIMLTTSGSPKLMDFGIARRLDGPSLTQAGLIVGTPNYMAPEICRGLSPSPRSDIYSLGATMYHLLVGRQPLVHEDPRALMSMIMTQDPADPRQIVKDTDGELADLIMQCLRKDPGHRPASMLEVAQRLDPFFTDMAMKTTAPVEALTVALASSHTVQGTLVMPAATPTQAPISASQTKHMPDEDDDP